ncbi:MAG: sugar phosphate nucleotidyltransferase [Candidatus Zixiibacteriota bacterium]
MRVIIPAAGIGSRLRPHTHTIPKSLLHVAGKPILGHILDSVVPLRPEEIVIITGFLGEKVQEYVNEHYDIPARFVQQEDLLGLGYAVNMGLEGVPDCPVLIILGDTIVDADIGKFTTAGENVLGLMHVSDPQRFGIAEVKDAVVTELVEKPAEPKSDLALIGLYFIQQSGVLKEHLEQLISSGKRTKNEFQLTDALQLMIEGGVKFTSYPVDGWYDCGKRETLIATNRHLLKKNPGGRKIEGSIIVEPSYIAPSAVIENSIIGPYVSVSDKAVVKNSIIKNSIVGFGAEVNDSLLSDSLIGHKAQVTGDYGTLNVGDSSEVGHF